VDYLFLAVLGATLNPVPLETKYSSGFDVLIVTIALYPALALGSIKITGSLIGSAKINPFYGLNT
jgi:hypothetical protein